MGFRPKGWNKYKAKKCLYDNIWFDSKLEAARYAELKVLEAAQLIRGLKRQEWFRFIVNGVLVTRFRSDFSYFDVKLDQNIVEDVKGYQTDMSRVQHNLFRALFPEYQLITIKNIRR